jgi:hypothetical protein
VSAEAVPLPLPDVPASPGAGDSGDVWVKGEIELRMDVTMNVSALARRHPREFAAHAPGPGRTAQSVAHLVQHGHGPNPITNWEQGLDFAVEAVLDDLHLDVDVFDFVDGKPVYVVKGDPFAAPEFGYSIRVWIGTPPEPGTPGYVDEARRRPGEPKWERHHHVALLRSLDLPAPTMSAVEELAQLKAVPRDEFGH